MIRMNDFQAEPEELMRLQQAAIQRVLESGRLILGPEVRQFEEAWAGFCGAKFSVGVGNGMDAIEIGLRALDIGAGDEVITTPMTAIATVLAITRAGATPVLADIDSGSVLLDLESVKRCLSPRTRAVLPVHLYGQIGDMDRWIAFCREAGIRLLEDCAQAHGAVWNGRRAGVFGAWGAFSFYPTKNLGAKGDAGALVTNDEEIARRARSLRNYGEGEKRDEFPEAGVNSRLDELQAAILSARLPWLERFNLRRRKIAEKYMAGMGNPRVERLSAPAAVENHVYHLFVVRCAERDRLADTLKERGIETLVRYPIPVHRQKCCAGIRCDPSGLARAENHAAQCLCLPCHPQLGDDDAAKVIEAINCFE